MPQPTDLLQGTLDLLILGTLALELMHGWGIAQRIQLSSQNVFQIGQGSPYPALHRLDIMPVTRTGKKQLEVEIENWDRLAGAGRWCSSRARRQRAE
jgi:PadR family transcriptional regulator, regulatory protein PadR